MELVPLSSDGRVIAVDATEVPRGPLRVALQPAGGGVGVIALGSVLPRPVGRLDAVDAAAYAPVLRALWAQRRVGTCSARIGPYGTLVLELAPAAECVFANLPGDLVLLSAEHSVTVTREAEHEDVLAGRVVVELSPCTIAVGPGIEQRGVEVRLDGRRVGVVTGLAAEHHLPMLDELFDAGRRIGCEALLGGGDQGVQLRLPAADARDRAAEPGAVTVRAATPTALPTGALPIVPAGPVDPAPEPPPPASVPLAPGAPTDLPATPESGPSEPSAPRSRRPRRRTVWAGAATVGVVVLAAAVGNGLRSDASTATASATVAIPARSVTSGAAPVPAPALTSTGHPKTTARSARTTAPPSTRSRSTSTSTSTSTEATSGCSPSYSPCVPIRRDVRCRDLHGHVRVKGPDVYGLDPDGDGIGCD